MGMSPVTLTPKRRGEWTPLSLSSLYLWFDPSFGVYSDAGTTPAVAGTDTIYRWVPRFNADKYAEQSVSGSRLSYQVGANGMYYWTADGTDDFLTCTGTTGAFGSQAACTLAANCRRTKNTTYQSLVSSDSSTGFNGASLNFDNANNSYSGYGGTYRNGNNSTGSWFRLSATSQWNGSANVCTTYHGGVDVSGVGVNSSTFGGNGEITIAARPNAGSRTYFGGYGGDIVVCTAVLGASDLALLDAFLASRIPT
jgi:hypothetical protein